MTRMITAALALGTVLAILLATTAAPVYAHHAPSVLGTVRITQPVMAGGMMLQPGTYEVRLTGEHVTPLPGQSADAGQRVEFVSSGDVAAREVAEVLSTEGVPVGTSGGATTRARVELLKGGDFLRVSMWRGGERYLIHLPVTGK